MKASSLADYRGRKVKVICEQCDVLKSFDGDQLFEQHGDANMPGLLDELRKMIGCEKPKSGFYNRCNLTYYFTHDEWATKQGLVGRGDYEIALGKMLADLEEWHVLTAKCGCGHQARLSHKTLIRRFGKAARIKMLAGNLLCQKCKKYDSTIEVSSLPR